MKKIMTLSFATVIGVALFGQMQTVQLNAKKLQFDDGRDLPAEKAFIITTEADNTLAMVKMQLASGDFEKSKILYESAWKRKEGDKGTAVILPNHYKLRSGNDYNFRFLFYRSVQENERKQIINTLQTTAYSLMMNNIEEKEDRYKFLTSPADLFEALNGIVEEGMVNYETISGGATPAFSGVVKNMLRTLAKTKMDTDSNGSAFSTLISQVNNEIALMANNYQYVLDDSVVIPDYPAEKKRNVLALNLGYAGIYRSGSASDLDYFSGPYAGVSFPLGNRVFSGNFWNNASLSVGVFLRDFKINDSTKVSGPVIEKPFYAALGYKVFNYLKIHAGAAVLEEKSPVNDKKSVYLKPFVGLSLELNLWLGQDKK